MKKLICITYDGETAGLEELFLRIYLRDIKDKICYVSVNKTFSYLSSLFESHHLDPTRLFVIDCASKLFNPADGFKNSAYCTFTKPLELIDDLATSLQPKTGNPGYNDIVVDSLSSLMVYFTEKEMMQVVDALAQERKSNIYFVCSRSYLAEIFRILERCQASSIQNSEREYTLQFKIDVLFDLCQKLGELIAKNKKKESESLYDHTIEMYNSTRWGYLGTKTKRDVYLLLKGLAEKIRAM